MDDSLAEFDDFFGAFSTLMNVELRQSKSRHNVCFFGYNGRLYIVQVNTFEASVRPAAGNGLYLPFVAYVLDENGPDVATLCYKFLKYLRTLPTEVDWVKEGF